MIGDLRIWQTVQKSLFLKIICQFDITNEESWKEHFNRIIDGEKESMAFVIECLPNREEILSTTEEEKAEKNWVHSTQGKRHGFSKKHRLTKKSEINLLFEKGGFRSCGFLKFRYLSNTQGYARVLISISKRVGKAPTRNRLKRLIRESLRTSGFLRNRTIDCAIYITKPLQKKPTLETVQKYMSRFFLNLPDDYKT